MSIKNKKKIKKNIEYYKNVHGFKEPLKVHNPPFKFLIIHK